jgi:hypothetical protein
MAWLAALKAARTGTIILRELPPKTDPIRSQRLNPYWRMKMHTLRLAQKPSIPSSTIKKPMKLIDSHTGLMECIVCGSRHFASIQSGGRYYRGSWQCSWDFCPAKDGD